MTPQRDDLAAASTWFRLIERYGLATVLSIVLLWYVLGQISGELRATRQTLEGHVKTTVYGNYLQYVTCVELATMAGTPKEACNLPENLK